MKFARMLVLAPTLILALVASLIADRRTARAEVPILETNAPGGDYGLFEEGQYVSEPWFMWFVLGELSSADDVDMTRFDYKAGDRFKAEIFIPGHEELRAFNPTIALIGPGLPRPAEQLPFEIPEGMGAVIATSDGTFDYFDIFTQMVYFPRAKIEVVMPQTGRYYVAVWGEPVGIARYALDIGIMENFAPHVLARYPINWWEVRDYLQWGHWPALLVPPLIAVALLWLMRRLARRRPIRQYEQITVAIALTGLTATFVVLVAQQTTGYGPQIAMTFSIAGVVALALAGAVVWGAYILTPLRERLNLREFASDDQFVWVNGYAVHYTDDGPHDAPVVVLIHGFAASVFTWRHVKAALLAAGYRVIAVDQLGYGASARPAEPIYTTQTQAELILGVLDALGVRRAHFVGHSFGGRVAMQVAILAPERVRSLVALAPEAFATGRPGIARWVRLPVLGYVLAFYSTSPWLVRPGLRFVSAKHNWITPAVVKGYAGPLHVRGSALAQVWQARSPKDGIQPVPHNLAAIDHPTLLLWGERDPVFPVGDGHRLAHILPAARLCVLTGAGHLVHEECPAETQRAILDFLADLTGAHADFDSRAHRQARASKSSPPSDG
ncbi:MAG: alpha/beta fold hydrolase [Thermoflexales bacterium]|nr:alpha/beta fold hydrolase [Thermoflexales bacterium]MDW8351481.1 alpha/beta fold hydrolase [Anaerolineae bacterium]